MEDGLARSRRDKIAHRLDVVMQMGENVSESREGSLLRT